LATDKDIFQLFSKEIGEQIKKKRLAKDLSLEKLGLEIGITRMHMHRIENGYNITLKTILKISLALGTDPESLLKTKLKFKKNDLEYLVNISKANGPKKK
jgi:transcriptional regulator with XRE-family HTH domain